MTESPDCILVWVFLVLTIVLFVGGCAGCCCVAADCPQGPADLIGDGLNGRLISSEATDRQWVEQLEQLLLNPALRQGLALKAQDVRERYAPAALQRCLLQALEQVVREGSES